MREEFVRDARRSAPKVLAPQFHGTPDTGARQAGEIHEQDVHADAANNARPHATHQDGSAGPAVPWVSIAVADRHQPDPHVRFGNEGAAVPQLAYRISMAIP